MGTEFTVNENTQIEYYYPKAPMRYEKRIFIAYPFLVYSVFAPQAKVRSLNLFQKVILSLCRVHSHTADEISELIKVDPELVSFIISELQAKTLLGDDLTTTEAGREALSDINDIEDIDPYHQVTGFVYQDPWTGELIPRFVESTKMAAVDYEDSSDHPSIVIDLQDGSGRSYKQPVHWILPKPQDILSAKQPTPMEVIKAIRRHARAVKHMDMIGMHHESDEYPDTDSWHEGHLGKIDRVHLIEPKPSHVFLGTFLFTTSDFLNNDWYVCDPFGGGISPFLKKLVEKRMEQDKKLKYYVTSVLFEDANKTLREEFRKQRQHIESRARSAIFAELKAIHDGHPLFGSVLEMEMVHQNVQLLTTDEMGEMKNIPIKAQQVIERLFRLLWEEFSSDSREAWRRLPNPDDARAEYLNAISDRCGVSGELPTGLARVKFGKIRYSCEKGGETLRARILASLLVAHVKPDHFLRNMIGQDNLLLHKINDLAEIRDKKCAHDSQQILTNKDVEYVRQTVYHTVRLYLNSYKLGMEAQNAKP